MLSFSLTSVAEERERKGVSFSSSFKACKQNQDLGIAELYCSLQQLYRLLLQPPHLRPRRSRKLLCSLACMQTQHRITKVHAKEVEPHPLLLARLSLSLLEHALLLYVYIQNKNPIICQEKKTDTTMYYFCLVHSSTSFPWDFFFVWLTQKLSMCVWHFFLGRNSFMYALTF